ncbi:MAG TPA: diacylglyceryl transferase [Flavobacteriaceae bacterium]|nr:diacylglyceryl transferase [Flavobacteriaceae bacterium]
MNRLKKHWNISSNSQLILILLVFAVNGSLSGIITKPILTLLGIHTENTSIIIYWILYFIIISIIYFSLLIIISRIFGQTTFFRKFAKKSLSPLGFKWFFD